jgi:hypothetical protein
MKGWEKYAGGLSNEDESVFGLYSQFEGKEIMFHVSTFLRDVPTDPQRVLEKKKKFFVPEKIFQK